MAAMRREMTCKRGLSWNVSAVYCNNGKAMLNRHNDGVSEFLYHGLIPQRLTLEDELRDIPLSCSTKHLSVIVGAQRRRASAKLQLLALETQPRLGLPGGRPTL